MTRVALALGAAALAALALGSGLRLAHQLVPGLDFTVVLAATALTMLSFSLAALALAEPARAAGEPLWRWVAALAALNLVPILLMPFPVGDAPAFLALRLLYAFGPLALVLAGAAAARARGARVTGAALGLGAAYCGLAVAQVFAPLVVSKTGVVSILRVNTFATLTPLVLVAYLLVVTPGSPIAARVAGGTLAVAGAILGLTSMQAAFAGDGLRALSPGVHGLVFALFTVGLAMEQAGVVLLATGGGLGARPHDAEAWQPLRN